PRQKGNPLERPWNRLLRMVNSSPAGCLRRLRPGAEPLEDRTLLSFFPPVTSSVGASSGPHSVVIADFNGDGKADMAVGVHNGGTPPRPATVNVFLGNANGTFQQAPASAVDGTQPIAMAAGDFNGDGKKDLVLHVLPSSPAAPNAVSVLFGKGDG